MNICTVNILNIVSKSSTLFGTQAACNLLEFLGKPFNYGKTHNKAVTSYMEAIRSICGVKTYTTIRVSDESIVSFLNLEDNSMETLVVAFNGDNCQIDFMSPAAARTIAA